MRNLRWIPLLLALGAFGCSGMKDPGPRAAAPADAGEALPLSVRIFLKPLPDSMPGHQDDTPEAVALGRKLYFERGISLNKTQSCNDCHRLDHNQAGVDYLPTSKGAVGTFGTRNSPTVLNAGFQLAQFWDGRAADLKEQAKGPVLNPVEMGMSSPEEVVARLKVIEGYPEMFARAFPGPAEPMTYDNAAAAIAAFERTLITPSRFDRMMSGERGVMTEGEMRGLRLFADTGCLDCHAGRTVGGRLFERFGVYHPYPNTKDPGRKAVTGQEQDLFVFKVPMLRNVTLTPPYFHDGGVSTLPEAIRTMGRLQLNRDLTAEDIAGITQFLRSLEAEELPNLDGPAD